jgi:citrate lyase subunit beta/citryl-CoA lyase
MRLRSIISIGASGAGLDDALGSQADAVLMTLAEASRPITDLRHEVAAGLGRSATHEKAALVVVNHPRTRLLRDDISAILSPLVKGVLLPHAVEAQDIRDIAVLLREFELQRGIEPGETAVFPVIDTARGLVKAAEIASAAPRVGGLVFHSHRYARDIGARDEQRGDRLAYARGQVVAVSRSLGQSPLVVCDGLELTYLAEYGFAGAVLPDARMVIAANAAFAPPAVAGDHAREAVAAYDAARAEGAWVARLGGQVVDAAAARKARHLIGE